jgi:hypothetical protein
MKLIDYILDYILKEARVCKWSVLQEQQIKNMVSQFVSKNKNTLLKDYDIETNFVNFLQDANRCNVLIIKKLNLDIKNEKLLIIWFCEQLVKQTILPHMIYEDADVIKNNLELYFKNKKEIHEDLYSSDYGKLKQWVQKYKDSDFNKHQEFLSKPIAQGKEYKIYKVTDIDTCIKIGKGTSWCIQGEKYAKLYLSEGPLYLVTKNDHRFALLSFESAQFMDVNDNQLSVEAVKDIFRAWPKSKDLLNVKKNGELLKYIEEQTLEICLEAVKQDGMSLIYVKKQTPEICLAAVKQYAYALEFVKIQTPEICLAAVRQNGMTIRYVKEQTEEICLAAVKQSGWALEHIKDPKIKESVEKKLNL